MDTDQNNLMRDSIYGAIPPIDITSVDLALNPKGSSTITSIDVSAVSPAYTFSSSPNVVIGSGTSATGGVFTVGPSWTTNTADSYVYNKPSATISLKGENADIDINGKSMKAWMEKVEERLNILTTNPELEKEWDELRRLGERYRKLEQRCKKKSEVWNKLTSMPPPDIK